MKFRSFLSYFLLFLALIPMDIAANPSFWVKALHDARSNPVTTLVIGGVYSIAGYYAFQEGYSWYKRRMLNSATILKLINQADTTVKINENTAIIQALDNEHNLSQIDKIVKTLLLHGANPKAHGVLLSIVEKCYKNQNQEHVDALIRATVVLLEQGANPHLPNAWGNNAVDWAQELCPRMYDLFINYPLYKNFKRIGNNPKSYLSLLPKELRDMASNYILPK